MIDRVKGEIVWICDGCDDDLETGTDDFTEARNDLNRQGWLTTKKDDAWAHYCSRACLQSDVG